MKRVMTIGCWLVVAGLIASAQAENQSPKAQTTGAASNVARAVAQTATREQTGSSAVAIRQAAAVGKHLFIFFYEKDDAATRSARKTFKSALGKIGDTAIWMAIDRNNSAEKEIVREYGIGRAPMPLVLVLAPNGAITGGFPAKNLSEDKLRDSIASRGFQACLKALQERKLVFVCAQNSSTKSNDAAMQGVNDFKSDLRFANFTEIVKVDPSDAAEAKFLAQLKIDPKTQEASTAFLAPPGVVLNTTSGSTSKDTLIGLLMAASSGCGAGGCAPSGCGPSR